MGRGAIVNLKFLSQVDRLLRTGHLYILRHRGRVGLATVSYNGLDIGLCMVKNVGRIKKRNGELYVDCRGELKPLSDFVEDSGIDKDTLFELGEKMLKGSGSRATLCKVELVKVFWYSRKLLREVFPDEVRADVRA